MDLRSQILFVAQQLHGRNLLAAADGNISAREGAENILITPTGRPKAFIRSQDMATIDINNNIINGHPSGERLMHLAIYQACPQAKAVVHAHPPTAIALSLAFPNMLELPNDILPEVLLATGSVPIVPYARPGTDAMGENLKAFLPEHRALILSRHGAVSWGESLEEAYMGMERIEHSSEIIFKAMQLGELKPIDSVELEALKELRKKIGPRIL